MKVLFVASGNKTVGKVSAFVQSQYDSLVREGVGMLMYPVVGHGPGGYLKHWAALRRLIRREKPDIVHAHYSTCGYLASLAAFGTRAKVVVSLLGSFPVRNYRYQLVRFFVRHVWDATVVTPEAPAPGLTAKVLSSTALPDIEDGEYSGITWLSGNNYAVVDNDQKGGGILHFTIPIDNSGYVGDVSMRPAAGTVVSTDKNRDNEGITYVPSLGTLYVSSERHQEIREYDLAGRATGKALQIPSDLAVKAITSNRGFEALTFNNATGLFWTMTEAPLAKDTFLPRILRLQSFGTDGKPANRFLYQTGKPTKSAESASSYVFCVSCMAAMDDGRILVLEREVFVPKGNVLNKVRTAFTKMNLYVVDPVHDSAGILRKSLVCSFKTNALDLANFEGMCLGPTLPDGRRCLVLIADSQRGAGGLTQEYVRVILLK